MNVVVLGPKFCGGKSVSEGCLRKKRKYYTDLEKISEAVEEDKRVGRVVAQGEESEAHARQLVIYGIGVSLGRSTA
jgi:hypothetical protein